MIKQAIEIEKEYISLQNTPKRADDFGLHKKIADCGYKDLTQFTYPDLSTEMILPPEWMFFDDNLLCNLPKWATNKIYK